MLAWSEGTDNGRQKTRNHGYDVIVSQRAIYWLLRSPSQTCHAKPKLKSTGAGRYQLLFPLVGCLPQSSLAWKLLSEKVRTLWHCSRLRSVALYLWLIVVISVRQSTIAAISGLHCRALDYGRILPRHKADSLITKNSKKRAERSEKMMYEQESPRLSPLWLSASSSACHGLLIITVITPLPTKPSTTKMPKNIWSFGERGNYWHMQMRQRDILLALDAKYTKELADVKLKMMLCVMMLPLVVVGCTSKQSVSQCVKPPPPAWIMQPPRLADTAERDYFLQRADRYAKNGWRSRSILMSSADRVALSMGNSCNYWAIHTRFQRSINAW